MAESFEESDGNTFGPLILGIETSCDETAVALVRPNAKGGAQIVAEAVYSQIKTHSDFGGVVPEIAARAHIDHLDGMIADLMQKAEIDFEALDGIAATTGPGLIGGLMVGALEGKAIATALNKPFVAVNHLAGHALSPRLATEDEQRPDFPYLLLLVSGGHCQLLVAEDADTFTRLGTTIDDAAGEAFDKTAKLLNLGYPGGPAIEKLAKDGCENAFDLPRPLVNKAGFDFSFSGLKTAVRRTVADKADAQGALDQQTAADIAASFQGAVSDCLAKQTAKALAKAKETHAIKALVVAGGVAANTTIRQDLQTLAAKHSLPFIAPPLKYCTDNAVMIAWAAIERLSLVPDIDERDAQIRARWPLDMSAEAKLGSGKKGAKA